MAEHTSKQFDQDLEALRTALLAMGGQAEQQLERALSIISARAEVSTSDIADTERSINIAQLDIDAQCAKLIAKRQPTAVDLRQILSAMHAVSDIERIGDESKKIAKKAASLQVQAPGVLARFPEIAHMATEVRSMLSAALDSLARRDAASAHDVLKHDVVVDADFEAFLGNVVPRMAADPSLLPLSLELAFIAKSLERCGDHVKNIAEMVINIVRGEDVRHRKTLGESR